MEKQESKLEEISKCQLKTFVESQPHMPKYRNCYNCTGYQPKLPCYVEPNGNTSN